MQLRRFGLIQIFCCLGSSCLMAQPIQPPFLSPKSIPVQRPASNLTLPVHPVVESAEEPSSTLPLRAQEILKFWFGPLRGYSDYPTDQSAAWGAGSFTVNEQIRALFEDDVKRAILGNYNVWRETPRGRLALILLLDQFPRNIYANSPRALAADAMARGLVLEGIQRGDDLRLYPIERAFFYLPLKHAEDRGLQEHSVKLYQQLFNQSPENLRPQMQAYLEDAKVHRNIIDRFGRFPNRNFILKRTSTPEEILYFNR